MGNGSEEDQTGGKAGAGIGSPESEDKSDLVSASEPDEERDAMKAVGIELDPFQLEAPKLGRLFGDEDYSSSDEEAAVRHTVEEICADCKKELRQLQGKLFA